MSSKQLIIPGLEPPATPKLKRPLNLQQQIAQLQDRVLKLELELTLLRVQLEKGDKDHA